MNGIVGDNDQQGRGDAMKRKDVLWICRCFNIRYLKFEINIEYQNIIVVCLKLYLVTRVYVVLARSLLCYANDTFLRVENGAHLILSRS